MFGAPPDDDAMDVAFMAALAGISTRAADRHDMGAFLLSELVTTLMGADEMDTVHRASVEALVRYLTHEAGGRS